MTRNAIKPLSANDQMEEEELPVARAPSAWSAGSGVTMLTQSFNPLFHVQSDISSSSCQLSGVAIGRETRL